MNQEIAFLLVEALKIRRCIGMLNTNPEIAEEFLNRNWTRTDFKKICKLRCSGIKKMFIELPIIECEDANTKEMNSCVLGLTA